MHLTRNLAVILVSLSAVCAGGSTVRAADCEEIVARHMVGEALLAAHFVALAEKSGLKPAEINATLKSIAEKSAVQEFWITDTAGHAYLTNTGIDVTFTPDPAKQPQASAFWPLITGGEKIVIQAARRREIDNRVFKYVGVAGVDKPRIVQVGVGGKTCQIANSVASSLQP
jgi:adenylate cyclase